MVKIEYEPHNRESADEKFVSYFLRAANDPGEGMELAAIRVLADDYDDGGDREFIRQLAQA
ncbi:hypothetical protein [Rhizobium oryzicola]|uniref:Addiction module antidote protein n=1 Tax=Rhizobium oryzicola TaxID=1232668 RepID=A0ABT8SR39_9HYPH|nr:hypothetical protein [Rhizobium oryzicola]MDO1580901.1 hypothetical protein [Rhizobium oryzicola]